MSDYLQAKIISEDEYYHALYQINHIPSKLTGKKRQNLRQKFKKQIKEYEYNIKYTRFDPLPYIPYYVNRTTPESILQQLIQASTASMEFTLDTESMKVYKAPNRPSLIQIQILLLHDLSLVIIFEMIHLPPRYSTEFSLIKKLFTIIFSNEKLLYIWGTTEELLPFTSFNLFTCTQINSIRFINLQDTYKSYYHEKHPHHYRTIETPDLTTNECICEECIGKQRSAPWSLQDAVGRSLNEYLSKIFTEGDFHIGLDKNLFDSNSNPEQEQYRQALTTYALYDCLAMQRIIIFLKQNNFQFQQAAEQFIEPEFNLHSPTHSNDNDYDNIFIFEQQNTLPKRNRTRLSNENTRTNEPRAPSISPLDENHEQTNEDETNAQNLEHEVPSIDLNRYPVKRESSRINQHQEEIPEQNAQLSEYERKIIHNRSSTRKQRRRYYQNEIKFNNIDRRFTISQIKTILKRSNIPINNVKPIRDRRRQTITLHVAVREPKNIIEYETSTRNFFSSQHYKELQQSGELPRRHRHERQYHQHHNQHRNHHHRR